jgi:sterol desaturase/sphingolipid hydroxylase (fatty acid hydroxylase superfamily)
MPELLEENIRLIVFLLSSGFFFFLESYRPFKAMNEKRWRHILRNLVISFLNGLVYGLVFTAAIAFVTEYTHNHDFGLFRILDLPWALELLLSIFVLDFIIYCWHILAHRIPMIWRFHLVHHVDSVLDFSTGTRFHLGELLGLMIFHLPLYFLLGITLEALIIFQIFLIVFDHFGHANYRVPAWLDQVIRLLFITSNVHQVHHSDATRELNSNYGTVFSIWDRLFGTYNDRRDIQNIETGIIGYPKTLSFWELMKLPLKNH